MKIKISNIRRIIRQTLKESNFDWNDLIKTDMVKCTNPKEYEFYDSYYFELMKEFYETFDSDAIPNENEIMVNYLGQFSKHSDVDEDEFEDRTYMFNQGKKKIRKKREKRTRRYWEELLNKEYKTEEEKIDIFGMQRELKIITAEDLNPFSDDWHYLNPFNKTLNFKSVTRDTSRILDYQKDRLLKFYKYSKMPEYSDSHDLPMRPDFMASELKSGIGPSGDTMIRKWLAIKDDHLKNITNEEAYQNLWEFPIKNRIFHVANWKFKMQEHIAFCVWASKFIIRSGMQDKAQWTTSVDSFLKYAG